MEDNIKAVIFLDIDGVVNINSPSYYTNTYKNDGSVMYIEPHLVQRLNWLLERVEANIVISSSWRHDMQDLKEQLEKAGFKYWNRVEGKTTVLMHRGEEIQEYLNSHPEVKCYVVLEDEIDDVCGEKCDTIHKLNVIEINPQIGLTHNDVSLTMTKIRACQRRIYLSENKGDIK